MCDASSRPAVVSFAMCYCFHFLEVPDVVHRAGLVCQLWHKFTKNDAWWEAFFRRDTPPIVHLLLDAVMTNPLIDIVLAASAGVAAMLQHSVEERWDAVKWHMIHPLRHRGHYDSLAGAAYGSSLLSVIAIAQKAYLEQALNDTVTVRRFDQCPALHTVVPTVVTS